MIRNSAIIIFRQLHSSILSQIQVSLLKDVLQALVVGVDLTSHTVYPSSPEGKISTGAEVNNSLSNYKYSSHLLVQLNLIFF